MVLLATSKSLCSHKFCPANIGPSCCCCCSSSSILGTRREIPVALNLARRFHPSFRNSKIAFTCNADRARTFRRQRAQAFAEDENREKPLYIDEWGEKGQEEDLSAQTSISDADPPVIEDDEWGSDTELGKKKYPSSSSPTSSAYVVVDEWGERSEAGEDETEQTKLADADPPTMNVDEWGDGAAGTVSAVENELADLKKCLVGCFYGTEYGLRASSETRAEISELVSQLEARNPTPAPTEALSLLQGNWQLLYTSFSELLPLIAAGTLPLLKLEKICQEINTNKFTVENSATFAAPVGCFSLKALATFEVSSPKRIEVKFEEGILPPPEIKSTVGIPEKIDVFGQKIELGSLQSFLGPLQESATRISQVISGQPPLKFPLGRGGAQSWLLITYLDNDLRISRGDGGGLFILAKEGSSLLDSDLLN